MDKPYKVDYQPSMVIRFRVSAITFSSHTTFGRPGTAQRVLFHCAATKVGQWVILPRFTTFDHVFTMFYPLAALGTF